MKKGENDLGDLLKIVDMLYINQSVCFYLFIKILWLKEDIFWLAKLSLPVKVKISLYLCVFVGKYCLSRGEFRSTVKSNYKMETELSQKLFNWEGGKTLTAIK